jgi:uncharacterized protein Veg
MVKKPTINEIKKVIEGSIGKRVFLRTNSGKRNSATREGIVEYVYPSLFTIKITDGFDTDRRVSFTYSDILTESVLISFDMNGFEVAETSPGLILEHETETETENEIESE